MTAKKTMHQPLPRRGVRAPSRGLSNGSLPASDHERSSASSWLKGMRRAANEWRPTIAADAEAGPALLARVAFTPRETNE